jgi:hypothetical protein
LVVTTTTVTEMEDGGVSVFGASGVILAQGDKNKSENIAGPKANTINATKM